MPDYGMSRGPPVDRSKLPSAPRSARGADFDPSRVPTRPPFTAFLGNLQYDICEEDIERFFQKLKVSDNTMHIYICSLGFMKT